MRNLVVIAMDEDLRVVAGTCDPNGKEPESAKRHVSRKLLSLVKVSTSQSTETILRNDFDGPHEDGSYRWALQTEGGIYHEQRGSVQNNEVPSLLVEGQFQYTAPDGQVIHLLYTADENGYHPIGDHLPTPPPIPAQIQRALDYIAALSPRN